MALRRAMGTLARRLATRPDGVTQRAAIHLSAAVSRRDDDDDEQQRPQRGRRQRVGQVDDSAWASTSTGHAAWEDEDSQEPDEFDWGEEVQAAYDGREPEDFDGDDDDAAAPVPGGERLRQQLVMLGGNTDEAVLMSEGLKALWERSQTMSLEEAVAMGEAAEKGDDHKASLEDYRLLAEAIDLYFKVAPVADPELDLLEEGDRDYLEALGTVLREALDGPQLDAQVVNTAPPGRLPYEVLGVDEESGLIHWGVDLTDGRAPDPWRNAHLSAETKAYMYQLHKEDPESYTVEALAEQFRIRQQRVMAILALQELEEQAREEKRISRTRAELAQVMEEEVYPQAVEGTGSGERHVVVLPSYPKYQEVDKATALSRLEAKLGKPLDQITDDDLTPELAREVMGYASREETEARLAAAEEAAMVADFRRNLEYNLGKVGKSIRRSSRSTHPPRRPKQGWSLLVKPLGVDAKAKAAGAESEPFVAAPDGSRRELTADEKLYLERQASLPRRKAV